MLMSFAKRAEKTHFRQQFSEAHPLELGKLTGRASDRERQTGADSGQIRVRQPPFSVLQAVPRALSTFWSTTISCVNSRQVSLLT